MASPTDPAALLRDAAARHQAAIDAAKQLSADIAADRAKTAGQGVTIEPDASATK